MFLREELRHCNCDSPIRFRIASDFFFGTRAEIFPVTARDSAMALGIFINWIANWLVAFSFPILLAHTQPYTFLIFVATTAFFLFFTQKFVPETKGLTVTQVTKRFEEEVPLWIC